MLNALLAAVFAVTTLMPFWHVTPHQRLVARAQQSIVRVTEEEPDGIHTGTCTGFVVLPNVVLTAAHCIGEHEKVDGKPAHLLAFTPEYDIAMYAVPTNKRPVQWAHEAPRTAETVTGLGYGMGKMTIVDAQVREVDSLVMEWRGSPGLLVSPGWVHGMSGGPVLNARGELVGMVSAVTVSGIYGVGPQAPDIFEFLVTAIENLPTAAPPSTPPGQ